MVAAAVGLAQQRCQHCCCPPPSRSAALISPARVLPQQATLHSISSSSGSSSSSHRAQRPLLWHPKRRHATVIAAASPQPQPQEEQPQQPQQQQEDPPQLDDEDPEQQMARLPRPSQHHQPQLGGKQRAALRSQAEGLAKAKTLQRVQVGGVSVHITQCQVLLNLLLPGLSWLGCGRSGLVSLCSQTQNCLQTHTTQHRTPVVCRLAPRVSHSTCWSPSWTR